MYMLLRSYIVGNTSSKLEKLNHITPSVNKMVKHIKNHAAFAARFLVSV